MINLQCDRCAAAIRDRRLCDIARALSSAGYLRKYAVYRQLYNADGEPIDVSGNVGEQLIPAGYVYGYSYAKRSYNRAISVSIPAHEDSNSRSIAELTYLPLPCLPDSTTLQTGLYINLGNGRTLKVSEIVNNADITMTVLFEEG